MDTAILKTPKVLEVSKDHFKCDTIKGMELENQGGSGTLGAHWERTILHNEIMTGSRIALRAYSKFTMAVLEDSGWYVPDYTDLEPFFWGQNQGCDFINKGCTGTNFREFCTGSTNGCTFHRNAKGYCHNGFMSDSCSYITAFSNGDCHNPANRYSTYYGEIYGAKSKCFESTLLETRFTYSDKISSKCYDFYCNADQTVLYIKANNGKSATCNKEGEKASIEGYSGYIQCPDPKIMCKGFYSLCKNYCSSHGYCVNGKCECNPGHAGEDCSHQLNCLNQCNGRGACQIDGSCICNEGYSGKDCSVVKCDIGCVNGKCELPNKCKCNEGWMGEKCTVPVCSNNCNGNGVCVSPGQCNCNANWKKPDCKTADCPLVKQCSGNGDCVAPNSCTCKKGYFEKDCSVAKCPNGCNFPHGVCWFDKCYCWFGYSGIDCS